MFRPPFVIGKVKDSLENLRSRIFKKGDDLFYMITEKEYLKIGIVGDVIDFDIDPQSASANNGKYEKYTGDMNDFSSSEFPAKTEQKKKWTGTVWVDDGNGYFYEFQSNYDGTAAIPLFIDGTITQVWKSGDNTSFQFKNSIQAQLFFYAAQAVSENEPSGLPAATLYDGSSDYGSNVVPLGDIFFKPAAPASSGKSGPVKTATKKKKKSSASSSSTNQDQTFAGFLVEDNEQTDSEPEALSTDEDSAESVGEEEDEDDKEPAPKVVFSLIPPAPARIVAKTTLRFDSWERITEKNIPAKNFAGSLALHNWNPDKYPFNTEVRMCVDVLRELVLGKFTEMKIYPEFYNDSYGVERWNGRFIHNKPSKSNPVDLKNDATEVTYDPTLAPPLPTEVGLYAALSEAIPLELKLFMRMSDDEWIFGFLTR